MSNYKIAKIYKIVADETDKVYIGSTCKRYLCSRMSEHKAHHKNYKDGKGEYIACFDVMVYPNPRIELVELYPCENREQLRKREQYWKEQIDCVNRLNAFRSEEDKLKQRNEAQKRYHEKNKDKCHMMWDKYYAKNKEALKAKRKAQNEDKTTCICGGIYTEIGFLKHTRTKQHKAYIASL